MKKIFAIVLLALLLVSTGGCAGTPAVPPQDAQVPPQEEQEGGVAVDLDLTRLGGTMLYGQVVNMLQAPDDYIGKIVRMRGAFSYFQDPGSEQVYFACLFTDETSCCSQGIEFVPSEARSFPQDYPSVGESITVVGRFQTYFEGQRRYCTLVEARLE